MPAYNAEKNIEKSITSILNQTMADWELIIVNDGSIDRTFDIISEYALKDNRITVINREENKGIAYSRNEAIERSIGTYIAFLDSDDLWIDTKLEKQIKIMRELKINFSCTSYRVVNEIGKIIKSVKKKETLYGYNDVLKTNFIGCSTVIIISCLIKENKMPLIKHEDYATWLKILSMGENVYFINHELSIYTKSSTSQSSNKFKALLWAKNIIYSQNNISIVKKRFLFIRYVCYTGMKYLVK